MVGDVVIVGNWTARFVALERRAGRVRWEHSFGALRAPAVVPPFLWVLSQDEVLYCLEVATGRVVWSSRLEGIGRGEGVEVSPIAPIWTSPIVAGGRVMLGNDRGFLVSFDALSGEFLSEVEIGAAIDTDPIVVDKVLVVIDVGGRLIAVQ